MPRSVALAVRRQPKASNPPSRPNRAITGRRAVIRRLETETEPDDEDEDE